MFSINYEKLPTHKILQANILQMSIYFNTNSSLCLFTFAHISPELYNTNMTVLLIVNVKKIKPMSNVFSTMSSKYYNMYVNAIQKIISI